MNRNPNIKIVGAIVIILSLTVLSCSTKKNTFTRRVFHNLTAHYNAYWNGNESLKQGVEDLDNKISDNYNHILPVYNYGTEVEAQSANPSMDVAIEKASMVIQSHSMKFGGKEYVRWIDDSYMLIGKAYFYKQEYIGARRTFLYVMSEYPENDIKYNAMVWLAKTYNQMGQFEKSEPLLKELYESKDPGKIPFKVRREVPVVLANAYILQENYEKAINYLYRGIELNTNRELVSRLMFILAQIQQKEGNLAEASRLYLDVVKRNPEYDMAFQAKINLARSYEAESGNKEQIVKVLTKMLKDIKNVDYKDQIYFALAEVVLKDGQDSLGVEYLRLSVATSVSNDYQKATSSLKLADIYFEVPEYRFAEAYYDTAVKSLPEDYPNYKEIKQKADVLSELVTNLITIQLQDSLQNLARMPEDERLAIIDNIIEEILEEERRKMEEEMLRQQNMLAAGQDGFNQVSTEGGWYFYNNTAKSSGFNEFKQKWGNRKLEDLWRLSNKTIMTFEEEELLVADSLGGDSARMVSNNPKDRDYYLKDIPFTEEQITASNDKMIDAYFMLGRLYKEGLNNYPKSGESFETLIDRFPENKYQLPSYYDLYKIFESLDSIQKAEYYKNLVLSGFPESDYAKVIENPDYFKELSEQQNEAGKLYEKTYKAYQEGQYFLVINYCDLALVEFADSEIIPKFLYLKALSIGKVEVQDSLVVALQYLVNTYPKNEVTPLAENILEFLTAESEKAVEGKEEEFESPYSFATDESHFFAIVANSDSVNIQALRVRISDFNGKYFRLRTLNTNSILLDPKKHIITVGNFVTSNDAMNYYGLLKRDEYVISNLNPENYSIFVISASNYPLFYKSKDVQQYMKFFDRSYLKDKKN